MKKSIILILSGFLFLFGDVNAQNDLGKTDDVGRVAICPVVGDIPDMPRTAEKLLLTKMAQIASKNGMASYGNRFIMFPKVHIMSQDITPTAPPMHAYNLDATLYVADNATKQIFSSTTISLKGVGKTTTKAYIMALKGLTYKRPEIEGFVSTAREKIVEYYNSQCDFILKEAEASAGRKEFDEAIYTLVTIPQICKDCYMLAQDVTMKVYKMKMENECMEAIATARTAIAQDDYDRAAGYLSDILPDVSCYADAQALLKKIEDHRCAIALGKAQGAWSSGDARRAGSWLSEVAADSKCYSDALALGNQIKRKLKADEDREWDFKLKVHDDAVELEKQAIKAVRDIGVAWGENQPQPQYHWINNFD
ncbi:MAG: hypothetical protein VX347_04325 [Bacteroidota bacterium]|nr:hypothetical protein [Bacteroidota bacterium]